jgi:hypothetical protein
MTTFIAGCATRPPVAPEPPAPIAIGLGQNRAPTFEPARAPEISEPIYRNPKIAMVTLRAHVDAEGRLLGPQVMYQVAEPGGWNIEAAENGRGVIAMGNAEAKPNLNGPSAVAREVPPFPADAPLLDPERAGRITVTGLMREEDRPEAEARALEAGQGSSAVFDRDAGWLVVPGR